MQRDDMWQAVLQRDPNYDQVFVYAVKTTGIFCRPTCPSRRPYEQHVQFFETPDQALNAGYRACQRCNPTDQPQRDPNIDLMIEICRYLERPHEKLPTLAMLSTAFAMSPHHLQRTFKRIVGVSPRQYADGIRQGQVKQFLKTSDTITEALYTAGYTTTSQFYEQSKETIGMTPITYRKGGAATSITYTTASCKLGYILIARTEHGICTISLGDDPETLTHELTADFPHAHVAADDDHLQGWVQQVVASLESDQQTFDLPLDIQATSFQRKVWDALRKIPYGETRSYQDLANMIDQPTASRAVARACATNSVALVIPCHRVVRKNGDLSGYRWGIKRKAAILDHEKTISAQQG